MIDTILPLTQALSLILLAILSWVDLQKKLLPNIYVFPFALLGVIFHISDNFSNQSPLDTLYGALAGGGALLAIRTIANHFYKQDTLGLGDVKLMGAAGIWLGIGHIFMALGLGAFLGVLHGLCLYIWSQAHKKKKNTAITPLSKLSLPAGPGFILGIIITGAIKFYWT